MQCFVVDEHSRGNNIYSELNILKLNIFIVSSPRVAFCFTLFSSVKQVFSSLLYTLHPTAHEVHYNVRHEDFFLSQHQTCGNSFSTIEERISVNELGRNIWPTSSFF